MNFYKLTLNIFLLFALFLFDSSNTLYAQYSSPKYDQLTIEDGLSQNSVFSILEDSRGFMWFGTRAGGLNKYDGSSFTVYKHKENDPLSISDNEITALEEDLQGNIWVGTHNNGINKFDYESGVFHKYLQDKSDSLSLPSNIVHCIYTDRYNKLWVGTDKGLVYYDKKSDRFLCYQKGDLKHAAVKAISSTHVDSLVWAGTKTGLYLFDIKNSKTLKHFSGNKNNETSLTKDYVSALQLDRKGRLWIGLYDGGLNRLDHIESNVFKRYQYIKGVGNSLASNNVRKLLEDKDGTIWIATKSGLDELIPREQENQNPRFIHHKKNNEDDRSISANSIYSIYEDSKGDFWVGNYTDGVNYTYNGPVKFKNYNTYNNNFKSISNNVINAFLVKGNETWIATKGGGLNVFNKDTGEFTYFKYDKNNPKGILSNNVKSIIIDSDNLFWVGTSKGVSLFNKEKKEFTTIIKDIDAVSIEEGIPGELWIGTNKKLIRLNKLDLSYYSYNSVNYDQKSLSSGNIYKVFKDSKERIWIATKAGLNRYNRNDDNFIQYKNDYFDNTSISHSNVTSICEDISGNIWFGTYDGLNRYDEYKEIFIHYGELDGLPGNVISNILPDNKGNLWITSNNLLTVFTPKAQLKDSLTNALIKDVNLRIYDTRDGLQKGEFRLNASYKSEIGEMYLGGSNGYNKFHPDSVIDNVNIPRIAFTDFKLFNKSIIDSEADEELANQFGHSKSMTLNHKQSIFTISFVALSYNSPSKNQFAHKMEGFDEDWNYIGNKKEATYTNLPAGDYIFRVKASNSDGVWNNEGVLLKITVLPPWWKTFWFRTLVIFLILTIIVSSYFYRITDLKRQRNVLENKVLERTSELLKANTKLEEINATKDKFQSIIAHDLKNPLGTMVGFLEMLKMNFSDYDEEKKIGFLDYAFKSALSIKALINNLLQWSQSQRGTMPFLPEKADLRALVNDEISLLSSMAINKEIELLVTYEPEEITIFADKNMLSTVVRNIVSNAIKFSFNKSKIKIKINETNKDIQFEVADNGMGIPKSVVDKLFRIDLNYKREGTAKEKGTGMGLALCKEFVDSHKGKIWAESEEGYGSTIFFTIPKNG